MNIFDGTFFFDSGEEKESDEDFKGPNVLRLDSFISKQGFGFDDVQENLPEFKKNHLNRLKDINEKYSSNLDIKGITELIDANIDYHKDVVARNLLFPYKDELFQLANEFIRLWYQTKSNGESSGLITPQPGFTFNYSIPHEYKKKSSNIFSAKAFKLLGARRAYASIEKKVRKTIKFESPETVYSAQGVLVVDIGTYYGLKNQARVFNITTDHCIQHQFHIYFDEITEKPINLSEAKDYLKQNEVTNLFLKNSGNFPFEETFMPVVKQVYEGIIKNEQVKKSLKKPFSFF